MDLIFRGRLLPGVSRDEAVARLARLLRTSPDNVARRLFGGRVVRIKTVATEAEAQRFVDAFAKAGAELEVRRDSSDQAPGHEPNNADAGRGARSQTEAQLGEPQQPTTRQASPEPETERRTAVQASSPSQPAKHPPGQRPRYWLSAVLAIVLVLVGLSGAAAWYTQPIWRASERTQAELATARALATEDTVVLGHLDVRRAVTLQTRFRGPPDPGALPGDGDDVWTSLQRAGLEPSQRIASALSAVYVDGGSPGYALVLHGDFDSASMRQWIDNRYLVDHIDENTQTVFFNWLDDKTCEPVPLKAAQLGERRILIASADRVETLRQRLRANAGAQIELAPWLERTRSRLLTVGVFRPSKIGGAADGMVGMMLAGAGRAAEPAKALYFGATPVLMPPGLALDASVASDNQPFLERAHTATQKLLDEAKAAAKSDLPELLDIYERVSLERGGANFSAAVRLDTDFDEEIRQIVSAILRRAFSISAEPSSGSGQAVTERVDDSPQRFADASATDLKPFSELGNATFTPQWEGGPFAVAISRLKLGDDDRLALTLRAHGRGLPNIGPRSELVRMRVTDVVDGNGQALLDSRSCGPAPAREWSAMNQIARTAYFENGESIKVPTVSGHKQLRLNASARAADVAAIRGQIEYRMPVRVSKITVEPPLAGKVVERNGLRLHFRGTAKNALSYQVSGDTERLLAVRALNDQGKVLATRGSTWGDNVFGMGKHATVTIQGEVAAAEVIVAEAIEPERYAFELAGAYPPITDRTGREPPPIAIAEPETLAIAMQQPPPEVTFDYNEPEHTITAGPAVLAIQRLTTNAFQGLFAQMRLFVPNTMPVEGQLNAAVIVIDRAVLPNGETIPLGIETPLTLTAAGAYWMNGEYTRDPDKPWLHGSANIQASDYEADKPTRLEGHIIFRAPKATRQIELPAEPGSQWQGDGLTLKVADWREDALYLTAKPDTRRILAIEAIGADAKPAGWAHVTTDTVDGSPIRIKLIDAPETLQATVATGFATHSQAFFLEFQEN